MLHVKLSIHHVVCVADVEYLRSVLPANTDPDFFLYLKELDCSSVSVSAVPEGSVVFARVRALLIHRVNVVV